MEVWHSFLSSSVLLVFLTILRKIRWPVFDPRKPIFHFATRLFLLPDCKKGDFRCQSSLSQIFFCEKDCWIEGQISCINSRNLLEKIPHSLLSVRDRQSNLIEAKMGQNPISKNRISPKLSALNIPRILLDSFFDWSDLNQTGNTTPKRNLKWKIFRSMGRSEPWSGRWKNVFADLTMAIGNG